MVPQSGAGSLNTACDECRERKLKCSGHVPSCLRCAEDGVQCHYSPRKTMGRPRKRQRAEQQEQDAQTNVHTSQDQHAFPQSYNDGAGSSLPAWSQNGNPRVESDFALPAQSSSSHLNHTPSHADGLHSYATPSSTSYASDITIANTCNCIMMMTNILEQLRLLQTFQFPLSIGLLRNAMSAVHLVILCQICPDANITALQNQSLMQAVMFSLVDRFRELLKSMNEEADRLARTGETKAMKVADPDEMHVMHTGTPDCPAGLVIQLQAMQWRQMSEAALAKLLFGPELSMTVLLDSWEARQEHWHSDPTMFVERLNMFPDATIDEDGTHPGGCISTISRIRKQIQNISL